MTTGVAARSKLPNPFPGLRPFRVEEEYLFFGRESQVDSMVDKLAVSKFLAVVGTSGSGKSSLVNCGLRPSLLRGLMARAGSNWRMAQFRPGGGPIKALACALAEPEVLSEDSDTGKLPLADIFETTLLLSKLGLVDLYEQAHLPAGTNLLVVVDQFEELFRFRALYSTTDEDRATAFVNLLLEAARSAYPIYVVLTMRSDFLGDCAQFEGLPEAINRGEYLVPRMTREERRRAITGPVHVGGGEISPVLLTQLLNDVGDNPDQLSIMQHALNRTWAHWQNQGGGAGAMSLEHYEAIGTMAHALDQHAEKAFAELPDERAHTICKKIFQALTDKGSDARGVRRPTRMKELCALAEASPAEVTTVMDAFRKPSRSFLMPPAGEKLDADTVVDISHESLMRVWKRLREWVEEETASAAQYIRLVDNGNRQGRLESGLLCDPELSLMLKWREDWQPNVAWAKRYAAADDFKWTMIFLERSQLARDAILLGEEHERTQELRRARAVAAVFGVLFIIAVIVGIYAYRQHSGLVVEQRLKDQQKRFADAFKSAFQAQAKASEATINWVQASARHQGVATAEQQKEQAENDAAEKTGAAFLIMGGASALGTEFEANSDLFEGAQATCESGTQNCVAMFTGPTGGKVRATLFSEDKEAEFPHRVDFRTKNNVMVASVGLHAAHQVDNQRAFTSFSLFAKGRDVPIAEYSPALPYGGVCGKQPCLPAEIKTDGRQVLSVCLNIPKPVLAQDYYAVFVQAISPDQGGFTGPMILQLDGYPTANCGR